VLLLELLWRPRANAGGAFFIVGKTAMPRNELQTRDGLRDLGEIELLLVVSSIDSGVYCPFTTRDDASAFAENADGSIFECRARLTSAREIW